MLHEDGAFGVEVGVLGHGDGGLATGGREDEGVGVTVLRGRDGCIVLSLVLEED